MKSNLIQKLYLIFSSLTLILHAFNSIEIGGGFKLFHIPAAAAFILTFFIVWKKDKIHKFALGFIAWSFLGALTSPWDGSMKTYLTFLIVTGSMYGVRFINDGKLFLHFINILLPFVLLALAREYFVGIYYRFTGFYEDPNYLCTTLVVFLYLILMEFNAINNKYIKLALLLEIVVLLFIVTTTISRTGIVCTLLILIITFWGFFKKNKVKTLFVVIALGIAVINIFPGLVQNAIDGYVLRESNADNFDSATSLRGEISKRGIIFITTHTEYLLQGIGVGAAAHHENIPGFNANTHHGDHNTITSSITEQGVVGCILFILLLFNIVRKLWYLPKGNISRRLSLIVFVSIMLFSLSINNMLYLPYWFLMFYLSKTEI